ncbi:MAG: SpoIIE family protein phosphatase [Bacilli bacterium]|nr:SpoIIE family protein phosphatase [Bacilli bacterium]
MAHLYLALFALISPVVFVGFYFLERWDKFHNLNFWIKQAIFGVVFGGVAILCTEFGVKDDGVVMNVRDSAVIIAGLFCGWPAGVISGAIGGIERFFSTYWTGATFTQVACSISTFISGLMAGLIRKFVFKNKNVAWYQAFGIGVILETNHILMIFITNMNDVIYAFKYVQRIGNPMILFCALSVMSVGVFLDIIKWRKHQIDKHVHHKWHIATILHSLLFVTVAFAYINIGVFTFNVQNRIANTNANALLSNAVYDLTNDVIDTSNSNLMMRCHNVTNVLEGMKNAEKTAYTWASPYLKALVDPEFTMYMVVSEINYVDDTGIIIYSSNDEWIGYDMRKGEQSNEFYHQLIELKEQEFVQEYRTTSGNDQIAMKYAGKRMSLGGFIQVGYSTDLYYSDLQDVLKRSVQNRHIGEAGIMIIADSQFNVVGHTELLEAYTSLAQFGMANDLLKKEQHKMYSSKYTIDNSTMDMRYLYSYNEAYYIIGIMNEDEITLSRNMSTYINSYLELIVLAIVFFIVYIIFNRYVLSDLHAVNKKLRRITSGDLNVYFDVDSSREFAYLSDSINSTVGTLKGFIAKEAERMEKELALAKAIQLSSLPTGLAYLAHKEFAVYALMQTAKEVGGDFYDYFQLSDGKFVIVIADVSGKGVPAALFMMRAKSLIKSFLEIGMSINEAIQRSNIKLCEGNDAEMFVTCWAAVIDTKTGVMEYVNAGHNPPLIRQKEQYTYLRDKANFVLGAFEKSKYEKHVLQLEPGDVVFLYTDGITEAQAVDESFYGENRLKEKINTLTTLSPEKITKAILEDASNYSKGHEQSDDMTLLGFAYYGPDENFRYEYEAKVEEFEHARLDITKLFKEKDISEPVIDKFILCLEEIFVNIASYAYKNMNLPGPGKILLDVSISERQICITFIDGGEKFNPLRKDDPDITLSAKQRQIGGLGIFMVKKMMDNVYYSYQEKCNILTITMFFNRKGGK